MTVVMYLPNKGQESSTTMFWRVLRGSSRSGLGTLWEKHRYRMFWLREATLCLNCRSVISLVQNSLKKKNSGLCIHKRLVMMIARGNFNLAYIYYNWKMPSYYSFVKIKCIHIKFICIYVYIYWKALYKNFKKYKLLTSNTFPSLKLGTWN